MRCRLTETESFHFLYECSLNEPVIRDSHFKYKGEKSSEALRKEFLQLRLYCCTVYMYLYTENLVYKGHIGPGIGVL